MNELRVSSTGFPGTNKTWRFLQDALSIPIGAIAHIIGENVILTGVEVTGTQVSDGFIIYNGEILPFQGGTKTNTVTIIENITNVNYNVDINDDTLFDNLPAYIERFAKCGTGGVTAFNFSSLKRLNSLQELMDSMLVIATQTETNAGTDDTKVVTPKKLHNRTATTTRRGIAEIATQTETNAGTDDTRIVTPKKLIQALTDLIVQATETKKGIAEIATQAETNTGTDDTRIVTPKKLKALTATTARAGISELATYQEINDGVDEVRTITPKALKTSYYKITKITKGTLTTLRRSDSGSSYYHNNFFWNYAHVYPPSGYTMSNLVGFIPSIANIYFGGDVDGNDVIWCRWRAETNRITVTAQNSENDLSSTINYLAIWQK